MSLVKKSGSDCDNISLYLSRHPDFFTKYPELLEQLQIPHITSGNVSSLVEYQVQILRKKITDINGEIDELNHYLKKIRQDAIKIHSLSLQLLQSVTLADLYLHTGNCLREVCNADRVLLYLFHPYRITGKYPDLKCLETGDRLKFMFTEIFHRDKPLCNSLQEEHVKALFAENHQQIKSTLILPMQTEKWQGLLVTGSRQANQFGHGFELDLLVFLGNILKFRLTSILSSARSETGSSG